jgi:hypothetical protein
LLVRGCGLKGEGCGASQLDHGGGVRMDIVIKDHYINDATEDVVYDGISHGLDLDDDPETSIGNTKAMLGNNASFNFE